jgi:hypothetical protein
MGSLAPHLILSALLPYSPLEPAGAKPQETLTLGYLRESTLLEGGTLHTQRVDASIRLLYGLDLFTAYTWIHDQRPVDDKASILLQANLYEKFATPALALRLGTERHLNSGRHRWSTTYAHLMTSWGLGPASLYAGSGLVHSHHPLTRQDVMGVHLQWNPGSSTAALEVSRLALTPQRLSWTWKLSVNL